MNTGRGAIIPFTLDGDSVISYISAEEAEYGYRQTQIDERFEIPIQTSGYTVGMSAHTDMAIRPCLTMTHEERVYGRKIPDTPSKGSYMQFKESRKQCVPIKPRIVPTNMSITSTPIICTTRKPTIKRNNTYFSMYKQAEGIVKQIVIRGSNSDPPVYYTREQQEAMLQLELTKLPKKFCPKYDTSPNIIYGKSKSLVVNSNKKFINMSQLTHKERLEYNNQRYVIQNSIDILIAEYERNSGGSAIAVLSQNGGSNYQFTIVDITAPDVLGGVQATATATTWYGAIDKITITEKGSGYTTPPTVTINALNTYGLPQSGSGAIIHSTIEEDYISEIFINNTVTDINVIDAGKNFKYPPSVIIESNSGSGAKAKAFIANGKLTNIVVTDGGSRYKTAPSIVLSMSLEERYEIECKYLPNLSEQRIDDTEQDPGEAFGDVTRIRQIKKVAKDSDLAKKTFAARTSALRAYIIYLENVETVALATATTTLGVVIDVTVDPINAGSGYIPGVIYDVSWVGIGQELLLKAHPNLDGQIANVEIINGGFGYGPPLVLTIAPPDSLNNFIILKDKANLLTEQLYRASGIKLQPFNAGTSALKSDILQKRKCRFVTKIDCGMKLAK